MTPKDLFASVRPQFPDDSEPPPTLHIRNRDIISYNAYVLGMEAQAQAIADGRPEIEAYMEGWLVTAKYLRTHNRRRTALDDIL